MHIAFDAVPKLAFSARPRSVWIVGIFRLAYVFSSYPVDLHSYHLVQVGRVCAEIGRKAWI